MTKPVYDEQIVALGPDFWVNIATAFNPIYL